MHTHLRERGISLHTPPATMVLQFAFHVILILCFTHTLGYARDTIIAQPGCNSTCGGVDIPYPFGMNDPKCYADRGFEIECNNTNVNGVPTPTPYLKLINVAVISIDLGGGTIDIQNPAYTLDCRRNQQFIDLRGSPFVYSQERNKFVALGCNIIAFLMSNGTKVGACASICDDINKDIEDHITKSRNFCSGKYCCETSLPSYLSEYNVTTEKLGENQLSGQCNYAVIVEENAWASFGPALTDLSNLMIDAVLEWEIVDSTLKLPANCNNTNVTSSQQSHSGRRCYCPDGFDGNPYIDGGCIRGIIPFPAATQIFSND